ncbi:MAG: hypothetical protein IK082_10130, partial [Oscillospiraceae bacterium]|nr:hypothetical protein [Oscillospiraceae bacterium]
MSIFMIEYVFKALEKLSGWSVSILGGRAETALFLLRYLIPVLGVIVLLRCLISLFREGSRPERWGRLVLSGDVTLPLTHWENTIGRGRSCDIRVDVPTVSR